MNQMLHQTLHQQLVQLRERHAAWLDGEQPDGLNLKGGICVNVNPNPEEALTLGDLMVQWPDGSGVPAYPVPSPMAGRTASAQFYYADPVQKWHPMHEYARNRLALLDWLIEQTATNNN